MTATYEDQVVHESTNEKKESWSSSSSSSSSSSAASSSRLGQNWNRNVSSYIEVDLQLEDEEDGKTKKLVDLRPDSQMWEHLSSGDDDFLTQNNFKTGLYVYTNTKIRWYCHDGGKKIIKFGDFIWKLKSLNLYTEFEEWV